MKYQQTQRSASSINKTYLYYHVTEWSLDPKNLRNEIIISCVIYSVMKRQNY